MRARTPVFRVAMVFALALLMALPSAAAKSSDQNGNGGNSEHVGCQGDGWGYGLHTGKASFTNNTTVPVGMTLSCLLDLLGLNQSGNATVSASGGSASVAVTSILVPFESPQSNFTATLEFFVSGPYQPRPSTTTQTGILQTAALAGKAFTITTYNLSVNDRDLVNDSVEAIDASINSMASQTIVTGPVGQIICFPGHCGGGGGGGGGGSGGGGLSVSMCLIPSGTNQGCALNNALSLGVAPVDVLFGSTVSGGTYPYTYTWNFGDSNPSSSAVGDHVFANPNTHAVSLTVSDSAGHTASAFGSVYAAPMPSAPITISGNVQVVTCLGSSRINGFVVDGVAQTPASVCPGGVATQGIAGLNIWVWWRHQGHDDTYQYAPFTFGKQAGQSGFTAWSMFTIECATTDSNGDFSLNTVNAPYTGGASDPHTWVQPYGISAPDGARYSYVIQVDPYNPGVNLPPPGCQSMYPSANAQSPLQQSDSESLFTSFEGGYAGSVLQTTDTGEWPMLLKGPSAFFDDPGYEQSIVSCSGVPPKCYNVPTWTQEGWLTVMGGSGTVSSSSSTGLQASLNLGVGLYGVSWGGTYQLSSNSVVLNYPIFSGSSGIGGRSPSQCIDNGVWSGNAGQSVGVCASTMMFLETFWSNFDQFSNSTTSGATNGEYTGLVGTLLQPTVYGGGSNPNAQIEFGAESPLTADPDGFTAGYSQALPAAGYQPTTSGCNMYRSTAAGYSVFQIQPASQGGPQNSGCGLSSTTTTTESTTLQLTVGFSIPVGAGSISLFNVGDSWSWTYNAQSMEGWLFDQYNPYDATICFGLFVDSSPSASFGAIHAWPAAC